jgi:hypothetical protein
MMTTSVIAFPLSTIRFRWALNYLPAQKIDSLGEVKTHLAFASTAAGNGVDRDEMEVSRTAVSSASDRSKIGSRTAALPTQANRRLEWGTHHF